MKSEKIIVLAAFSLMAVGCQDSKIQQEREWKALTDTIADCSKKISNIVGIIQQSGTTTEANQESLLHDIDSIDRRMKDAIRRHKEAAGIEGVAEHHLAVTAELEVGKGELRAIVEGRADAYLAPQLGSCGGSNGLHGVAQPRIGARCALRLGKHLHRVESFILAKHQLNQILLIIIYMNSPVGIKTLLSTVIWNSLPNITKNSYLSKKHI